MKNLSPEFAAHLAEGTTTLAWCWRLARADGLAFGFTDHDRDLTFAGTTYEAASGFTASEIKDSVGLATDDLEVDGALSSHALDETDLAAGRFDGARVEIWRVNWADVGQRVLMRAGTLGQVSRTGAAFTAEVRGLAQALQEPKGRLYQYQCDADLGDARCTVNLTAAAYHAAGSVVSLISPREFVVAGLTAFADDFFSRGRLVMTGGANAGLAQDIRRHTVRDALVAIELWQPLGYPVVGGDTFTVTAGCDKHFGTCQAKFANAANFRGFPHIPGADFLSTIARGNAASILA